MDTRKIKEITGPILVGAAAGAIALAIVGFSWGGWVTSGTAQVMAQAAVVKQLVPICVEQFNADPQKEAKLAALKKTDYWQHTQYVAAQGWATMPGEKKADDSVARDCASRITG